MGSWRKMGAFLGLVPGEDGRVGDYDYDDFESDVHYEEPMTDGALAMQPRPVARPVVESAAAARPSLYMIFML